MKKILAPEIVLEVLKRKEIDDDIISATKVRQAIAEADLETIGKYVPKTTFDFIKMNLKDLLRRINNGN